MIIKMRVINLIRSISYALFSKIVPSFYYPYRCFGGRIYIDITESSMMLARVRGKYEIEKHKAIRTFLKPGGIFIDVGANKGDFSLVAAKLLDKTGKVIAFEPESKNCKWITKSININGYKNISLYKIALSDHNGEAKLYIGKKSGWHTLISSQKNRNSDTIDVKVRTLDSYLKEISFCEPIDMIKIDVEGAELQVLRGAYQTLFRNKSLTLLIDIHPTLGVDPKEVCYYLVKNGFSIFYEKSPFLFPVTCYKQLTSIVAIKSEEIRTKGDFDH